MELKPLFQSIADAIRQKDGTAEPIPASSFPARIRAIPGGPAIVSPKDVNFYDYDGTLVYSYTLSEAQALTALPDGPTHDGLVFQGWNWSLEKVKALTRPMNVGAMYITDDGKTRLKIRVWDVVRSNVPLHIGQTVSNGVVIDWGDGSSSETLDGAGRVNITHKYAAVGEYTITLAVADGCKLSFCVVGGGGNFGIVYRNLVQEVCIGDRVTMIDGYVFNNCASLKSITIPEGVTSIGNGVFANCHSLASITIPRSVTSISNSTLVGCNSIISISIPEGVRHIDASAFNGCTSLKSITIPEGVTSIGSTSFHVCKALNSITIPEGITGLAPLLFRGSLSLTGITISENVTSIGNDAFADCRSLASIIIPENVTSIGDKAFSNCSGMAEYHLKPATPPTLANTNVFDSIPSDCIIYVPAGSLEAYKTAENWSAYADYMREE